MRVAGMKNILIAAGDAAIRDKLVLILSREKYSLKVAMTYEHSLKIIWASPPHIVLLDFECPTLNAPALVQGARTITPDACFVAIHSDAAFDLAQHGLKHLIQKPLTRQGVISVLTRCLAA
jgi:DNA-binding NtrC family response regulator